MFNVVSPRTSLAEIIIPATFTGTNQKQNFPNQEQLMSVSGKAVYMKGVQVYSSDFMPTSPLSSGVALASALDITQSTMTLSAENDIFLDQVPLTDLVRNRSNMATTPFSQDGLFLLDDVCNIDWTKCFITLTVVPLVLPVSFLFNFHYGYSPRKFYMLSN